jgi:hypothetical protein
LPELSRRFAGRFTVKCHNKGCPDIATHEIDWPGEGWTGYCELHALWAQEVLRNTTAGECAIRPILSDSSLDWIQAEQHLRVAEEAFAEIGPPGAFALAMSIRPARKRYDDGERSPALFAEIVGIKL